MKEEDFKYADLYSKVLNAAEEGPDYPRIHQIALKREAALHDALQTMTKEQRQPVLNYFASQCAVSTELMIAAYELGRRHGPRKEKETLEDWVDDPEKWKRIIAECARYPDFRQLEKEGSR